VIFRWAKLTPDAGNVVDIALAAEAAGADAVVMGNTMLAMAIDIHTRRPRLGNVMGIIEAGDKACRTAHGSSVLSRFEDPGHWLRGDRLRRRCD
jgi:hypothetical protein